MKKYLTVKNGLLAIFLIAGANAAYKSNDGYPETLNAGAAIAFSVIAAAALIGFVLIHINETNRK